MYGVHDGAHNPVDQVQILTLHDGERGPTRRSKAPCHDPEGECEAPRLGAWSNGRTAHSNCVGSGSNPDAPVLEGVWFYLLH